MGRQIRNPDHQDFFFLIRIEKRFHGMNLQKRGIRNLGLIRVILCDFIVLWPYHTGIVNDKKPVEVNGLVGSLEFTGQLHARAKSDLQKIEFQFTP